MRKSLAKPVLLSLLCLGVVTPCVGQESGTVSVAPPRVAAFVAADAPADTLPSNGSVPTGLAMAPPVLVSPPAALSPSSVPLSEAPAVPIAVGTASAPAAVPVAAPSAIPNLSPPVTQAAETITKVEVAALPDVSPEAIGVTRPDTLGDAVWKNTSRGVADRLLALTVPTRSPVLNDLVRRLLMTVAPPPEGKDDGALHFTSLRINKLAAFADVKAAWDLAQHGDAKLIDDVTFHNLAEAMVADGNVDLCKNVTGWAKTRAQVDWQKSLFLCQIAAKDNQAAQVSLDVLRAQVPHDEVFVQIADKTILNAGKTLPSQLSPVNTAVLGALRLTGLPFPDSLYEHADALSTDILLHSTPKHEENRLALAERLAERGLLGDDELIAQYKAMTFKPEDVTQALNSAFSGGRLRALLFQAAAATKESAVRAALAAKFFDSCTPAQANRLASIGVIILGDVKPDASVAAQAASVTPLLINAGKIDAALVWSKLLQNDDQKALLQKITPQKILLQAAKGDNVADDLARWVEASVAAADAQGDAKAARDTLSADALLLDAAGIAVPDNLWAELIDAPRNEKKFGFSPLLMERLRAAASAGRRGEVILLAAGLAQEGDIALPVAVETTRALRDVGLKTEAVRFAQQSMALLASKN